MTYWQKNDSPGWIKNHLNQCRTHLCQCTRDASNHQIHSPRNHLNQNPLMCTELTKGHLCFGASALARQTLPPWHCRESDFLILPESSDSQTRREGSCEPATQTRCAFGPVRSKASCFPVVSAARYVSLHEETVPEFR